MLALLVGARRLIISGMWYARQEIVVTMEAVVKKRLDGMMGKGL